jgi:predicted O-methyltransferase YrrM
MNSVLAEIIETGTVRGAAGGGPVTLHSAVSVSEGHFLQKIVRELDPTVCVEVGLAFGVSALFICDSLTVRPETKYFVIDPAQHTSMGGTAWDGIGLANLVRAGYGNFVNLIEEPSYRALSKLEQLGQRIDFAFIDGWHTFDFAFVDFFFIDRMLKVGGVVAFDDADWSAVRRVCRFVKNNLSYSLIGADGNDPEPSVKRRAAEALLRNSPVRRLLRPEVLSRDSDTGLTGGCVAFRKESEDSRGWDHYVDF